MTLPPGVNQKNFSAAVEEFKKAMGVEWVFTSDEDVNLYRDAYTPFRHEPGEIIPAAALAPKSVEERITSKTRAIIVVDIFGLPYDAEAINDIAQEYNLFYETHSRERW